VPPLLARYRVDETSKRVDKAIKEAGLQTVLANPRALPNDARRLRGLPCVARNVAGEVFGSRPDREVVRRLDR
jgi:hypothetical protein